MKKIIIIIVFILSSENAKSFSVRYDVEHIKKYRDTVANQIKNNELQNIKVQRFFELAPTDTAYLRMEEEELLLLITKQYDVLLQDILNRHTVFSNLTNSRRLIDRKDKQTRRIYRYIENYFLWNKDNLYPALTNYLQNNQNEIRNNINNSNLTDEEKDFLLLFYDYFFTINDLRNFEQEQKMLADARLFNAKYPASKYLNFVNRYINIEYQTRDWGVAGYFTLGTNLFTNNLQNYFHNPLVMYLCLELNDKRFNFSGEFGVGNRWYSKIKQDFFYDTLWQENDKFNFVIFAVTAGYDLYKTDKFNISPFLGVSVGYFSPYKYKDSLYYIINGKESRVTSQFPLTFGFNVDYRISESNYWCRRGRFEKLFTDARLRMAYQPARFDKLVPELKGGVFTVTLGVGLQQFSAERITHRQ